MYDDGKLIEELTTLYSGNVDYFLSVVVPDGFPADVIAAGTNPRQAYALFWQSFKGLRPTQQVSILQAILKEKSGSKILNDLHSAISRANKSPKENNIQPGEASELGALEALFDLPADVRLTMRQIERLLWLSVRPRLKFPPCKHPAVVHCAGVAAGGFAARAVWANSLHIQNQYNARVIELGMEEDRSEEKLGEHVHTLRVLRNMLDFLLDKRSESPPKSRNLLAKSLTSLPRGQTIMSRGLRDISLALEQEIDKMKKLHARVRKERETDWRDKIRDRFRESAESLTKASEEFDGFIDSLSALVDLAETDWMHDSDTLWAMAGCRPQAGRNCRP